MNEQREVLEAAVKGKARWHPHGTANPAYKHGMNARGKRHTIYGVWYDIKKRCFNKNCKAYPRYGGRGITVCQEWMIFDNFATWAKANGLERGLSVDRIDNDGNYCPENCRVVTISENSRKKSTTKLSLDDADKIRGRISEGGSDHAIAKEFGVSHGAIWFIRKGITHVRNT